jgi:hypothetical protein
MLGHARSAFYGLVAAAILVGPARTQERQGSGNYMLPLCKTWLRLVPHDLAVIRNEVRTGQTKPGGFAIYFMESGMCAGEVIGISKMLNGSDHEPKACLPTGVTEEQLVRVVVASIEKDPAHMHENFGVLASAAMMAAWPCAR